MQLVSAEMDETLRRQHLIWFEGAVSHCSAGDNLILLLTKKLMIVFLILPPAIFGNNFPIYKRIPHKKLIKFAITQSEFVQRYKCLLIC